MARGLGTLILSYLSHHPLPHVRGGDYGENLPKDMLWLGKGIKLDPSYVDIYKYGICKSEIGACDLKLVHSY